MSRYLNGLTLFAVVFFFHIIWIFQGLDLVDTGGHLTNQVMVFNRNASLGETPSIRDLWFLTDFVGGAWLAIANTPNLLWARIGGVLLFSTNALLSYRILVSHFDRRRVFLIVLAATLFITMRTPRFLIDYFTFPATLLTAQLFVLNRLVCLPISRKSFSLDAPLLGFIAVTTILARFSLIVLILLPMLVLLYFRVSRQDLRGFRRGAPGAFFGALFAGVVFALLFHSVAFLGPYLSSIKSQLVASVSGSVVVPEFHQARGLLRGNITDFIVVFKYTAAAGLGIYLASLLRDRVGQTAAGLALAAVLVVGSVATVAVLGVQFYAYNLINAAIGLVLVISVVFFLHDKGKNKAISVLLISSVFFMLISPLGSADGIFKATNGLWVALPLVGLLSYQLRDQARWPRVRSMFALNTVVLCLMAAASAWLQFTNVERDDLNRLHLDTAFDFRYLQHVYSTAERVSSIDGVLAEVDRLTSPGDEILVIGEVPLLYYLTQTRPLFREPWIGLEPQETIENMYENALTEGTYPVLLVYNKTDPDRYGPDDWYERGPKYEYLKSRFLGELDYTRIWESASFEIYAPPPSTRTSTSELLRRVAEAPRALRADDRFSNRDAEAIVPASTRENKASPGQAAG